MLALALAVLAVVWGFWLAYMVRYPSRWSEAIDAIHVRLARYGLSSETMKRAEKGAILKVIVGLTVVLMLACLVTTLRYPDALGNFIRAHHCARS